MVVDATGAKAKTSGTLVYDLVAFLVGNREQNFHDLIQRATSALFGADGEKSQTSAANSAATHLDAKSGSLGSAEHMPEETATPTTK